jgi:hypothetical protein
LAVETVRSLGEEEVDLSRYEMGLAGWYERFRQAQLRDWMLYLVEKHGVQTRSELIAQARQALDFSDNPMLRELGLDRQPGTDEMIERSIQGLFERGWLVGEERLSVTDAGTERLRKQVWNTRGEAHRLFNGRIVSAEVPGSRALFETQ